MKKDFKEIEVLISHPWVDDYVPLTTWIQNGPGPREHVAPFKARDIKTKEKLPLRVIPLQYRNNRLSRLLIRLGFLDDPWK